MSIPNGHPVTLGADPKICLAQLRSAQNAQQLARLALKLGFFS
jgi:hypothetical protein